MTPREHAELIERDRLALLARLEAEALIEPSPPTPDAAAPLTVAYPDAWMPPLECEALMRLERERARRQHKQDYDRNRREQARERRRARRQRVA